MVFMVHRLVYGKLAKFLRLVSSAAWLLLSHGYAAQIWVGGANGPGTYVLSNGVVTVNWIQVGPYGYFSQSGGSISCAGDVSIVGGLEGRRGHLEYAHYRFSGGSMTSQGMYMNLADAHQTGGTNTTGDLYLGGPAFCLESGALNTSNTMIMSGGYWPNSTCLIQTGGSHNIGNELRIEKRGYQGNPGYAVYGGELTVARILLGSGAGFDCSGGRLTVLDSLTMADCTFWAGSGPQELGILQLVSNTAALKMPYLPCSIHFRDSSRVTWEPGAQLLIDEWIPDGSHGVLFGAGSSSLTAPQVAQIKFQNPVGLEPGTFPAELLQTGELVPAGILYARTPSSVTLEWFGVGQLQSASDPRGPYTNVTGAFTPYTTRPSDTPARFFRLAR